MSISFNLLNIINVQSIFKIYSLKLNKNDKLYSISPEHRESINNCNEMIKKFIEDNRLFAQNQEEIFNREKLKNQSNIDTLNSLYNGEYKDYENKDIVEFYKTLNEFNHYITQKFPKKSKIKTLIPSIKKFIKLSGDIDFLNKSTSLIIYKSVIINIFSAQSGIMYNILKENQSLIKIINDEMFTLNNKLKELESLNLPKKDIILKVKKKKNYINNELLTKYQNINNIYRPAQEIRKQRRTRSSLKHCLSDIHFLSIAIRNWKYSRGTLVPVW